VIGDNLRDALTDREWRALESWAADKRLTVDDLAVEIMKSALSPEPHESHDVDLCDPSHSVCQTCGVHGSADGIEAPCSGSWGE
jgi:hypothetical protein